MKPILKIDLYLETKSALKLYYEIECHQIVLITLTGTENFHLNFLVKLNIF